MSFCLCPIFNSQKCAKRGNCRHRILSKPRILFWVQGPNPFVRFQSNFVHVYTVQYPSLGLLIILVYNDVLYYIVCVIMIIYLYLLCYISLYNIYYISISVCTYYILVYVFFNICVLYAALVCVYIYR